MMKAFLKEYSLWLLATCLMVAAFLVTFWLYRLPLSYFTVSLAFSLTVWLVVVLYLFYRFSLKMAALQTKNTAGLTGFANQPSDQAYQALLQDQAIAYKNQLLEYKQQEQKLQALVKMWSHQMKVPIAALSLMAQTDQLNQQDVNQQLLSLQNDLDNLLNYLKFSQHQDDFRFEKISVRSLVVEIIKKYRVACLAKHLSVSIDGDWQVKSDKKWLSFAISQIIDNAIKYSKDGGALKVDISKDSISISDNGIGILKEDLPRIFDEGFTGFNGHEHQKATGLGLYMTKNILEKLNLTISIDSEIEKGTQVRIEQLK